MPSQSLTLATLLDPDGSLANLSVTEDALANESITSRTINVASVTTDFISEGFANLYYTDERARLAISVQGAGSYDNANGIITIGGNNLNTSNVSEGANLYFTNARARAAISAFDNTIIYNEATGTIRANAAALGGFGGGPNVISVNGQVGVVTLQTDDISEATNLFFTEQRARDALLPDQTLLYDSSNGWLSIGQNVRPDSNVVFVEANVIILTIEDPEYLGNGSITFSNNTNAFVFSNTIIPVSDNVYDLGAPDLTWNSLYAHTINANIINASNTVIADTFVGNFQGNFVKLITVSSDLNSLVIDQESNPSLFLPKGSNVIFDLSNPLLNGIGFELGYDTNPLGNSEDVLGVTYVVNGIVTTRADYTSSFNASNTRLLYFNIPQSTGNSLVYYSPEYPTWKAPLVVAPPVNSDEVVEGDTNLYFSTERVQQVLSTVADGNVGVIYDENLNLLTLSQDITPNADIEFRTVTANIAFYGDIYGNVYGNIFGQIANLNNFTTDDIAEGNVNAYFTNLRVRQSLNAGYGIEYSPILGQFSLPISNTVNANVYGGVSVIPVINVDNRGRIVNVSNVIPDYSNVTTNVAPNVNGVLNLGTSTRRWKDIYLSGNSIFLGNTIIREPSDGNITILNTANQPADLVANTGALIETGVNIFFSNARAIAAVSSLPVTNLTAQLISTGNTIINDNSINTVTVAANLIGNVTGYVSNIDNFSTTDLKEGSNLYYTDQRVWSNVGSNIGDLWSNIYAIAGGGVLSTSNVAEGANLYFTNARVWANVGANIGDLWSVVTGITTGTGVGAITTSNVAEGANLYFTNTRTRAALSGGTGVTYIEANGQINIGQAVAPSSDVEFKNIVITGNLFVQGTETIINATELAISDNMIYLNEAVTEPIANAVGDGANVVYTTVQNHGFPLGTVVRVTGITPANLNQTSYVTILAVTSNTFTIAKSNTDVYVSGGNAFGKSSINPDLGWSGGYNDGTYHHAGMFRDATDGTFKIFDNYQPEPDSNIFIDTSHVSFRLANIMAKEFIGVVIGNVSSLDNHTTSNLIEGSNLYYTDDRVWSNVGANIGNIWSTVTGITTGNGFGALTTSIVAEGANLYFTNARARAAISVIGTGSYDEANGIITIVGGVETVNGLTGNVVLTTANIAEDSNLYFTNVRVQDYLSNVAGNIVPASDNFYNLGSDTNWWKSLYLSGSTIYFREGGNLSVSDNVLTFYDGAGNSVFSSGTNSTIIGNLLVTGETTLSGNTQINAATLTVNDGLIKLANANPDDLSDIGFYGKYIEESASKYTGLFRDATFGIYKFFKDLTLEPNVLVNTANATFTLADVEANQFIGTITSLSNHTTSNLTEGTNLYFTNARAREALTVTGTGSNYDNTTGNIYIVAGVANVNGQNGNVLLYTSNIAEYITEVNNLYFNNARARAAISNSGAVIDYDPVTGVISANVVAIGFNPDPVWANITAGLTTDFVPEANNKYYTNARVLAAVAGPDSNLANAIFNRITVYAGNEAGLQWATTATNSFANAIITTNGFSTNLDIRVGSDPLDKIRFFAPGNYNLVYNDYEIWHANSNVTTSNIAEGSNLYYTNDRVWANIGANVSYLLDTIGNITTGTGANAITTSNVAEGANLYFTNDRVWANVGANIGNINAWLFSHNTTSGITEGSRLYFTNARARAAVGSSDTNTLIYYESNGNFQVNVSTIGTVTSVNGQTGTVVLTTSNVTEGSNEYFTNNRVYSALLNATSNATPIGVEKVYLKYGVDNGIIFRSNNAADYANITANVFGGATYLTFHVGDNNSDQFKFYAPSSNLGLQFNDYRVWHEGNHGSASGLDADLLDGIQATGFLQTGTTTTSISEGTNLYFSNARARAAVGAVGSNLVYYEGNGNFQVIVSGGGGAVDSVNGQTGTVVLTTANITEDTNLYFTNARARAAVSGGTGVSYNESTGSFSVGQAVGQTNDVTFANLIVTGNLTVQGNALQFESNTLIINDPLIQIGKNPVSGDTVDLGFFGHYIQTGDVERHAGLFRDATDGNFKLFTNLDPEPVTIVDTANASFSYANLFVNNLYGTVFGSVNTISNFSTTDLAEGANLYFNNTRARAAVGAVGSNLVYYEANGNFQVIVSSGGGGGGAVDSVNGQTGTVVLTTANIAEVSNLYYTDDRVWANVGTNIGNLNSWVISNTSNIGNINSWIGNNIDQPVKTTSSVTFANVSITDYVNLSTKGLRFPADAFGGSGDTATIILTASSGEATRMTFTMTNDADDVFEFIAPSNNGLLMNGNVVWHAGNDGPGSGLDADLLDGQSGSYYLSTSNMTEGTNQFYTNTKVQGFLNSGADIVFGNANITGTIEITGAVIDKANIVAADTGASFTASMWSDTLLYFTGTQAQNATINMTGLGVGANVGDAVTFTVFITNGATPYYISTYQVDGTAVGVTTRWSGGGPYLGTASNVDIYQITIFKTAATPTYSIFVSASGFG